MLVLGEGGLETVRLPHMCHATRRLAHRVQRDGERGDRAKLDIHTGAPTWHSPTTRTSSRRPRPTSTRSTGSTGSRSMTRAAAAMSRSGSTTSCTRVRRGLIPCACCFSGVHVRFSLGIKRLLVIYHMNTRMSRRGFHEPRNNLFK